MRKNIKATRPVYLVLLACGLLWMTAGSSRGQKGFYMEEKKLYEKYRMSVKHFEAGKELYNKQSFKAAEKKFKKCLEVFPRHAQANFYLAHIMYQKSDLESALSHIESAEKNSEFMHRMYAVGYEDYTSRLRAQRDEIRNRIQQYEAQLLKVRQEQDRINIEAQISQLQSELGTVTSRLAEPLPEEGKIPADYFYLHGNIFFKMKKFQDAHDQYVEALKIDPRHKNATNNLVNLYFMAKQYQKAKELMEQAESRGVEIHPKLKEAILKAIGK